MHTQTCDNLHCNHFPPPAQQRIFYLRAAREAALYHHANLAFEKRALVCGRPARGAHAGEEAPRTGAAAAAGRAGGACDGAGLRAAARRKHRAREPRAGRGAARRRRSCAARESAGGGGRWLWSRAGTRCVRARAQQGWRRCVDGAWSVVDRAASACVCCSGCTRKLARFASLLAAHCPRSLQHQRLSHSQVMTRFVFQIRNRASGGHSPSVQAVGIL